MVERHLGKMEVESPILSSGSKDVVAGLSRSQCEALWYWDSIPDIGSRLHRKQVRMPAGCYH